MKTIPTQINRKYTVSSTIGCTITDSSGAILCNVAPHQQTDFTAISDSVTTDDDSTVISLLYCPHAVHRLNDCGSQSYTSGSARLLRAGHILDLGTLTTDTDLTALSFAESANVQTAELWLSTGTIPPILVWPADIIWLDGSSPTLSPSTAYRFALRREPNGKLIINLAYEYSI